MEPNMGSVRTRILYLQYTNPAGYPPLQHSSRILADAGWSVLFLGTGAAPPLQHSSRILADAGWSVLFLGTGAAGSGSLEFPAHQNIEIRRMPFCMAGWRQKLHF